MCPWRARQVGYRATQMLYVAATLGLVNPLVDAPQDADALARGVAAEPGALGRVLRGLAAEGVPDQHPDRRFSLTALGTCLRSDVPSSLGGAILARGDLYDGVAAGLLRGCSWTTHRWSRTPGHGRRPPGWRCTRSAGDFFAGVPWGADAYVLSRVIHDLDNEVAVRSLTHCRRATGQDGTFLLVEVGLPTRASERPAAIRVDRHMSWKRVPHLPSSTRSRPE